MAIEVAPKKRKKAKLINYALYLSVALLIGSALGYAFLYYSVQELNQEIANLEKQLIKTKTPARKELERKVLSKKENIDRFSKLLKSHLLTSHFFNLLESLTHKEVMFTGFELNVKDKNISLLGQTDNFKTLEEQLLLFNENQNIKKAQLSKLSITEEKKIEFSLKLSFKEEVLK